MDLDTYHKLIALLNNDRKELRHENKQLSEELASAKHEIEYLRSQAREIYAVLRRCADPAIASVVDNLHRMR